MGLALFCPITTQVKGYPFEADLPPGPSVQGVVLSDQRWSLDRRARRTEFAARLPRDQVREVLAKAGTLLRERETP